MKIYIASHDQKQAQALAIGLINQGHEITSRWITLPFNRTETHTIPERREIAQMDFDDVKEADALVLIAGPEKYTGGKFVEAGIAIGMGKKVYVKGRRENMLLWLESVEELPAIINQMENERSGE